ncbi:MAG TPA: GAF domain-containing protein [Sedimentisphaerales bacterium]|nr:GAF domain-containing protein [Sedimentisphaerales bacterium]
MDKKNTFWQHGRTGLARRLEHLDTLCGIGRIISAGAGRQDALCHVLDVLDKQFGLRRGTITLLTQDGKEARIEAVHNLSEEKSRSITYRIGEGVTGKVMETGRAAIIPRVSQEPLFLNRFERWNVTKQELSFICVPISAGDEVIGTISVDRPFDENAPLEEEMRILGITASMIANDLQVRREASIKRQELADENLRLRRELSNDGVIHGHNLPPILQTSNASGAIGTGSFKERINLLERDLIIDALKRSNGNLTAAARDLKTTPRIIRYRVKELGIDYGQYCSRKG